MFYMIFAKWNLFCIFFPVFFNLCFYIALANSQNNEIALLTFYHHESQIDISRGFKEKYTL